MDATDPLRDTLGTLDVNGTLSTYDTAGPPEKAGLQHPPGKTRLLEGAPICLSWDGPGDGLYAIKGGGGPKSPYGWPRASNRGS
eukprot:6611669-Pyramimonas_sp.AAC.1